MVMKFNTIVLLSCLFVNYINKQDTLISKKNIIRYENYKNNEAKLPYPFSSINRINTPLFAINKSLDNLSFEKIDGALFDFLINQNSVCQWQELNPKIDLLSPYPNNYSEFIKKRKKEIEMFYVGCFVGDTNIMYKSHIILVKDSENESFYNRYLLRINVADNRIVAIVEVASYMFDYLTTIKQWTEIQGCKFITKESLCSDDIDYTSEGLEELKKLKHFKKNEIFYSNYYIDSSGFIVFTAK